MCHLTHKVFFYVRGTVDGLNLPAFMPSGCAFACGDFIHPSSFHVVRVPVVDFGLIQAVTLTFRAAFL
jgi:hypothetical protein